MTVAEAREVLIRYNTWRRYDGPLEQTPLHPEPKEIGEAIDVAIEVLSKKQNERKPVHNAKEVWKEMRLEVYAQASGNRHEPNCSDDSTKMFSLCDIDEIFDKIGDSTVAPAEEDGPFDEDEFLEDELSAFLQNYDKEYDDDAAVSDVARHFYEIGKKQKEQKPHTDEEKEYVRTIKSIISDFIRDKKPENLAYYQRIYDWLDGKHVSFSCSHENGKPAEWSGQIEGGTNERKRDSIPCR